jgi:hypothetical protein
MQEHKLQGYLMTLKKGHSLIKELLTKTKEQQHLTNHYFKNIKLNYKQGE